MVLFRESVAPRLGVIPLRARGLGLHEPQSFDAPLESVAEEIAAVVQTERRRPEDPVPLPDQLGDPQVVPEEHELRMFEAEVRTLPLRVDPR